MDAQFPPSSPVIHDTETRSDPFMEPKNSDYELPQRGRFDYPTPNPSSTVGRSSSPARQTDDKDVRFEAPSKPTVSINRDFNIVNPHSLVLRVPLISSKPALFIGRSLKSCDFYFKTIDKAVSRTHIKIEHSENHLNLTCLGYNGFGMVLPRVCEVHKVEGKESHYSLLETKKPLKLQNLSKTIHLDYHHTEFHVSRGETVAMPRFTNILIQIGDKVILVNPDDFEEELTDEETIHLVKPAAQDQQVAEKGAAEGEAAEKKAADEDAEKEEHMDQMGEALKLNDSQQQVTTKESSTPINKSNFQPETPKKFPFRITSEEPTPIKTAKLKTPHFTIMEDQSEEKENESEVSNKETQGQEFNRASTPLLERTNQTQKSPLGKRRAVSEEPVSIKKPKREPARDSEGKLIIDDACINGLKNLREINNILINHLAFSRLSSTPASFLNTILAVVSKLSLEQLRTVLHHVGCIGVIYRQGKDAAGKPLEEEYYYIPEKDQDPERIKLVGSIKGHGGLRACRRKHKQYYWKKPAPIKK